MITDLDSDVAAPATVRALGEPVRWRIVELLACQQLCVCHLTQELGISQPLVSHHLRVLRDAGLVAGERFRYWTYYRIVPEAMAALVGALTEFCGAATTAEHRRPCS
ncbi:MAG: ArsR/SmtB family transcription factor [Acidimicrobiia bacterium]